MMEFGWLSVASLGQGSYKRNKLGATNTDHINHNGIQYFNGVWMAFCSKSQAWSGAPKVHTTGFHDDALSAGSNYLLPSTHLLSVLPLLPPTQLAMELLLLFRILQLQFQGGKLLQAMILSKSPSPRQIKSFALFRLPLLMQIFQLLLVLLFDSFSLFGIIFCTCWIILRLLFHIKSPMNYQQESSYHHQPFQSIIKQQSLPTYLLDAFCNHGDFCSLPYLLQNLDSHQSPSSISSALQHLNLFLASLNVPLTPHMTLVLSMIWVLLLALLH